MIAVIMAAGKGSRLGDYTTNLPKSLLPLNNKGRTLLDYNLDILDQLNVDKILIVTGFNSKLIENHTAKNPKVKIVYNPFWNHCNVLGSLYMALDKIDDDFLFLHADTLAELDIWQMLLQANEDMVLPFERKKCGEEEMKVVLDENNMLLDITKEVNPEKSQGEFLGIAKFSKNTVPYFKEKAENFFKEGNLNLYMESAVQSAIDNKDIKISVLDILDNKFVEVDFEEDYQKAKKLFGN
ncbi:Choline kinase [Maribacter sedimenticola]|uniref:Choline kinase n=1 Tax=Maribacter sedimenticola TaxID=228956 RepID=A0ABY1SBX8_9FLAO|nr:phosphocholine cytidylyltransferase family protein [Maribacter sedimenticola]SNR24536.1 Choline kinase [Maribacter sedimenticola]